MEKDAEIIINYKNPTYVLSGWTPTMSPYIISETISITAKKGEHVQFNVQQHQYPNLVTIGSKMARLSMVLRPLFRY